MAEKPAAERPTIGLEKDGPLKVTGLQTFLNSRGETIATKKTAFLCRCGASKNKPFCDGTHSDIGFTDEKSAERQPDKLETYEGGEVTILDNRGICSHAGYCTSGLPAVWRMGVEPWIDPDGAGKAEIVETLRKCPSGALSYLEDGQAKTAFHVSAEIQVSRDGPYYVRGGVALEGAAFGAGASREHYVLCRCGASRNKPFCDGSHWYAGFHDDEALTISKAARAKETGEETWVAVGKAEDFAEGRVKALTVGEKQAAVVRLDGALHALDGRCPHQGGPLGEGNLCDGALRCPWHGYDFDLKTGKGRGNEHRVEALKIREEGGRVEIALPKPKRSEWTVSHVIAETLVEWGVDSVFGMVGHSNLGMAEALRVQEGRGKLRFFGIRHEGAAAFACSGYAKVTGRPAACLSIAGPGATNLLTGLWDAKVDRAPVVALTGQVQTQVMGPGAFQDIDLASAFEAVARFSQTVLPNSDHAELASLAVKNAMVERDVAHLILPDEVQVLDAGKAGPGRAEGRLAPTAITPPKASLDQALYRIARAERPLIIVGYGARDGMAGVTALAEALNCPVITTFKAKGQIGDDHPLGGGVLGRSGTPVASWFMNESDLLIVFGASFSHHTGIEPRKPTIQVDFDRMALGKFHGVDEPVWGDIGVTAALLLEGLPKDRACNDQRAELAARWQAWRAEKEARAAKDDGKGINSAILFQRLAAAVPADAILSVDVGNNTYSFGRYFECRAQSVLMSGYLGSIGFGFPAAMGAWAAGTGRKVVSISGDGGFGQYLAEFTTAVKYGMDITHVLLNNAELGKISKEQRDGEWKVWQTSLHNPGFADYATLCGGTGIRVERADQLAEAFQAALAAEGPALVEVMADPLLT
ncbi:MAG: CDGSH iron-sulfur domain-containing protein [Kiloniellales bacterium]|nr:CDGSH iron-sulfur domain-containing protein [Kiloniellales bacterium]